MRVINDFTPWLGEAMVKGSRRKILPLLEEELTAGKDTVPEILEWAVAARTWTP